MIKIDNFNPAITSNGITQSTNNLQHINTSLENLIIKNFYYHHGTNSCNNCQANNIIDVPIDKRNIIEITCNGLLPSNYIEIPANFNEPIFPDDFVIVQHDECNEIAQVKMVGELVKIKRQYQGLYEEPLPFVIRKASNEDLAKIRNNIHDEEKAISVFKQAIAKFNLEMKLVSIHFQFDRKKLFFFYTADGRVDFRELAKELASEFKTRIELRQIGVRDEAKKIGGLGSCGREFCCISFLNNFKKISTQLASDQNLANNISKLSGPCNKLKCCLSFESEQ